MNRVHRMQHDVIAYAAGSCRSQPTMLAHAAKLFELMPDDYRAVVAMLVFFHRVHWVLPKVAPRDKTWPATWTWEDGHSDPVRA